MNFIKVKNQTKRFFHKQFSKPWRQQLLVLVTFMIIITIFGAIIRHCQPLDHPVQNNLSSVQIEPITQPSPSDITSDQKATTPSAPSQNDTAGPNTLCNSLWWSFLHMTDTGYMGQDVTVRFNYLNVVVTMIGWVFFTGFFLTLLINGYERYGRHHREGKHRYELPANHGVILGWNRMGASVVDQILKRSQDSSVSNEIAEACDEVVILALRETQEIQARLEAQLTDFNARRNKIHIFNGSFDSENELSKLNFSTAKTVIILGDPDVRACDSRNVEAAIRISKFTGDRSFNGKKLGPLLCFVHINDLRTHDLLQEVDINNAERKNVELRCFNFFEDWACKLWSCPTESKPKSIYPPLAHGAWKDGRNRPVRLFIVGFGFMGQAIALQAARIAHYGSNVITKIVVIDPKLSDHLDIFNSHTTTDSMYDVKFEFEHKRVEDPSIREMLKECVEKGEEDITIAICISDPDASMATALSLPIEVLNADIPIFVRLESTSGLHILAKEITQGTSEDIHRWKDIHIFGTLDGCVKFNDSREKLAQAIHNAYLERLRKKGWWNVEKPAQKEWNDLQEKYRISSRFQADSYFERLRSNGFTLTAKDDQRPLLIFNEHELKNMPRTEHDRWWAERILSGWALGKRNDRALLHPNMQQFDMLDDDTKKFDIGAIEDMPKLMRECYNLDIVRAMTCRLSVAVTGFRNIAQDSLEETRDKIANQLDELISKAGGSKNLLMLDGLALGADTIAFEVAQEKGVPMAAILPLPVDEYEKDFPLGRKRDEFRSRLKQCKYVWSPDKAEPRPECYVSLGAMLIRHSDILLAVWDEKPSERKGSAAHVINMALGKSALTNDEPWCGPPIAKRNSIEVITILTKRGIQ